MNKMPITFSSNKWILALLLVALVALILLRRMLVPSAPPAVEEAIDAFYERLGQQVEMVTSNLQPGTRVVVLLSQEEAEHGARTRLRKVYSSLEAEGLDIIGVEELPVDREEVWPGAPLGFSLKAYMATAAKYPNAEAVLSLYGVPLSKSGYRPDEKASLPPLLLTRVEHWTPDLQKMLDDGLIAKAVVPGSATGDRSSKGHIKGLIPYEVFE